MNTTPQITDRDCIAELVERDAALAIAGAAKAYREFSAMLSEPAEIVSAKLSTMDLRAVNEAAAGDLEAMTRGMQAAAVLEIRRGDTRTGTSRTVCELVEAAMELLDSTCDAGL